MNQTVDALIEKYSDGKLPNRLPKDYVVAIVDFAEKHVDRRFLNDSNLHAQLLVECMIGNAAESDVVRIYTGELKAECYKSILEATSSRDIRILADDIDAVNLVIKDIDHGSRKIEALPIAEKIANHFYTVGNRSFRFEIDHGVATAIANFNEPKTVEKLTSRFDAMWKAAQEKLQSTEAAS